MFLHLVEEAGEHDRPEEMHHLPHALDRGRRPPVQRDIPVPRVVGRRELHHIRLNAFQDC